MALMSSKDASMDGDISVHQRSEDALTSTTNVINKAVLCEQQPCVDEQGPTIHTSTTDTPTYHRADGAKTPTTITDC